MGNRPIQDFEDPKLKGKLNKSDFKSILDIAVLCVAKSSRDRPNIDVVFAEMDKAWKNTSAYKVCLLKSYELNRHPLNSSGTYRERHIDRLFAFLLSAHEEDKARTKYFVSSARYSLLRSDSGLTSNNPPWT